MLRPFSGNGYEKHGGSPQRGSPNRETYEEPPAARQSMPYQQSQYSVTGMTQEVKVRTRCSPLRENPHNIRQATEQSNRGVSHDSGRPMYYPMPMAPGKENMTNQARHDSTSATRVIEHSKAVTALSVGTTSIMCAEGIHDSIINSYRLQIQNNSNLDQLYETLKLRISDVQQRRAMLEESMHFLRQDYEKQMDQQTIDSQVLQADLELKKRENAEIAQENSSINIQIQDARNTHSQKETEIQQIRN